jgi:hypothetical protein
MAHAMARREQFHNELSNSVGFSGSRRPLDKQTAVIEVQNRASRSRCGGLALLLKWRAGIAALEARRAPQQEVH